jgi:hypothetical protein
MKISFIQSSSELEHIKKLLGQLPTIVPLSLEALIYCDLNKIRYLDPEKIISHDFYKITNYECDNYIKKINFDNVSYDFIKNEIRSIIRFKYYQLAFLIEIIHSLKKNQKISEIFVTDMYSSPEYRVMMKYPGNNFKNINSSVSIYETIGIRYKKQKKILFNNSAYNFRRFIIYLLKNKHKVSIIDEGIPKIKKLIFKVLGIEIIELKKIKSAPIEKKFSLNQKFYFKNLEITNLINKQLNVSYEYIYDLESKYNALSKVFNLSEIKLVISNSNRGLGAILIEHAFKNKIKSLMVSHGTIAESFNKNDEIYKKAIAEGVFSGKADFHAIQSKITKNSLKTHNLYGKPIITGNLVFAEKKKFLKNKNFICLYAVTNKPFPAMQFYGVEMFHEFYNNLKNIEKFSKENSYIFYIHLHPGAKNSIELLKKKFPNLIFKTGKIEKSLKYASVTLSYSSTVIEDSLHSKVPVILFDTKSRYRHCDSETNSEKKDQSVYYINDYKNLKNCIETIKKSKNIKFEDKIFIENSKNNIEKLFPKIIN